MTNTTHYEVYFKPTRRAGWSLIEAHDDKAGAEEAAQALIKTQPAGSARVSKEVFDPRTRTFQSFTVWEAGGEKYEDDGRSDRKAELSCTSAADLVMPHARAIITRALKGFLDRNTTLTLELMHRPDLVEKLEASGTELQHAVQKVAIAQASDAEASAQHFVKQINDLVQSAVERLYQDSRSGVFQKLKPGQLADFSASIAGRSDRERRLRGAVVQRLKGANSWTDKLDRLVALADEADAISETMAWPLDVVGEFVADLTSMESARRAFVPEPGDLGAELDGLTDLFIGKPSKAGLLSAGAARLAWHFADERFLDARTHIARRILKELMSPKRIRPSDYDGEVQLNRSIANRLMRAGSPLLQVNEISEAFVVRSGRLLEPEAVETYLASGANAGAQLAMLAALEENVVGDGNKRKLASYIRARVGAHTVENHYVYADTPALQRLSELAALRRQIDRAGFPDTDRAAIGEKLDAVAVAAEARDQVFDKIAARSMPALDKAAAFLRLAAKGGVPAGALADEARKRAVRLLSTPEVRAAVANTDDGRQKFSEISTLIRALDAA